jgi:putative NIF3 family GTP cyclohydrolase 1 type 2
MNMTSAKVSLQRLARDLDSLFGLQEWDADPAFGRFLPRAYEAIGHDWAALFEADFCRRFNGLMLRSGDTIDQVYCAAFPSPDVLEFVIAKARGDALLFLHHPIDMEVAGVGFLPIPPATLDQLRARGVSVYACHAPMDCHDEIGTNASIVQAFEVQLERSFAQYGRGYAGRVGTIAPTTVEGLASRGKGIFGVDRVEIGGGRPAHITRVAIVAGGGDEVELFQEAQELGAQAYITGEWYTRTTPADPQEQEWAAGNRAACQSYAGTSEMALLGFSHAATEFLVMKVQMADYFGQRRLEVTCLPQSDWWR